MTKQELAALVDRLGGDLPERLTGNEQNTLLAERLGEVVRTDRSVVVDLLTDWLSVRIPQSERVSSDGVREGRMWLSLEVAKRYALFELRPLVESLVTDIERGNTFLPYYAEMITKYLSAIPSRKSH